MSIEQLHFPFNTVKGVRVAKLNIRDNISFLKMILYVLFLSKRGFKSPDWDDYWKSRPNEAF